MRVLVLDGGGAKGLFTLEILRTIELCCGKPIRECFDLIVGTSIGAFIAGAIVAGKTLQETEETLLPTVAFFQKATPGIRSYLTRILCGHVLTADEWREYLHTFFGDVQLSDLPESPRLLMVAADATTTVPHPYLVRNRPLPETVADHSPFGTSSSMSLLDALQAVTAAPTIYPAHVIDGIPLVDGGILANNPVLFAVAEAKLLGTIDCIVSVGTGLETRVPHPSLQRGFLSWVYAGLLRCIDPDTPEMLAQGILHDLEYFRFNPPGVGDIAAWESNVELLKKARASVQTYMYLCQDTLVDLVRRLSGLQDNEDHSVPNSGGPGCIVSGREVP